MQLCKLYHTTFSESLSILINVKNYNRLSIFNNYFFNFVTKSIIMVIVYSTGGYRLLSMPRKKDL